MTGIALMGCAIRIKPAPSSVDVLIIAGGGGGGPVSPGGGYGGGGAGGYRAFTGIAGDTLGASFTITVGAGAARNANGSPSTCGPYTSAGGGVAGSAGDDAQPGGSGGGAGIARDGAPGNVPATTPSQGNRGGQGFPPNSVGGGGGGGAGGQGTFNPSNGGAGASSSITGSAVTRAGGGASNTGTGGSGGGGNYGIDGSANLGGGAGGGAQGGSGVVILAYPSASGDLTSIGAGLTYSLSTVSRSGFHVYTFTAGTGSVKW